MKMHTYIAQFAYDHGNGWAVINSPSPGCIEGTLKRQSRFQNITLTSYKEIEYFGNETSLMCEGGVTTLDKSPYDIAVENGFAGSETEWLESLKGENGKDATINGVSTLVIEAGEGISIQQINGRLILNVTGGDYEGIKNKPSINSHKLEGNKSSAELGLQDKLTFDTTPVQDSNKPITSGGVFNVLNTLIRNGSLFGGILSHRNDMPIITENNEIDNRYYYITTLDGYLGNFGITLPRSGQWHIVLWNIREQVWDYKETDCYIGEYIDQLESLLPSNVSLFGGFVTNGIAPIPYGDDHRYFYLAEQAGYYKDFDIILYNDYFLCLIFWDELQEGWDYKVLTYTINGLSEKFVPQNTLYYNLGFTQFDLASTYQIGDYVTYGKFLYKFINTHTGEWSENDVVPTNLVEYINNLGT